MFVVLIFVVNAVVVAAAAAVVMVMIIAVHVVAVTYIARSSSPVAHPSPLRPARAVSMHAAAAPAGVPLLYVWVVANGVYASAATVAPAHAHRPHAYMYVLYDCSPCLCYK